MDVLNAWLCNVDWKRSATVAGRHFRWGRIDGDYVGEWRDVLLVRADSNGIAKVVAPAAGAPRSIVEKLANGEAAAFIQSIRGNVSLHASAVAAAGRALVLIGESGAGKSTLASMLCSRARGELLADDVAVLDGDRGLVEVLPTERSVWLADGSGGKAPVVMRAAGAPAQVIAAVALAFDDGTTEPSLRRLHGASAVSPVIEALLRFEPTSTHWSREFDVMTRLVQAGGMFELRRSYRTPPDRAAGLLARSFFPQEDLT